MAVDITQIRAYTNGLIATHEPNVVPVLPTNASSPLHVSMKEIGAVSEDGVTESTSQDRTDIFVWQNNTLARRIPGQFTKQWVFAAAETSLFNLGIAYPGSTITQTVEGATIAEVPPQTDIRAWVLHGIDGTKAERIVVPLGEVTERGDVVWSAGDVTVREWTLTGYTDSNNVVAYRYLLNSDVAL